MRNSPWTKKMLASVLAVFALLFLLGVFKASELLFLMAIAVGLFIRSRLCGAPAQGAYSADSSCYFPDSAEGDHSHGDDGASGHSCSDGSYSDGDGGGCGDGGSDGGGDSGSDGGGDSGGGGD